MTLKEIYNAINTIAGKQPNINTILKSGNVYDLNNDGDIRYAAFCASQQQHRQTENFLTYNFYLYYVDRLTSDASNKIDIQSTAIQVLANIIRTVEEEYDIEFNDITYQVFTERFSTECAGAYANVGIIIPLDMLCAEVF